MFFDGFGTQHIHAREHPAAPRRRLVCDGLGGHLVGEVVVEGGAVVEVLRQLVDVVGDNGVAQGFVGPGGLVRVLDGLDLISGQSAVLADRLCAKQTEAAEAQGDKG